MNIVIEAPERDDALRGEVVSNTCGKPEVVCHRRA